MKRWTTVAVALLVGMHALAAAPKKPPQKAKPAQQAEPPAPTPPPPPPPPPKPELLLNEATTKGTVGDSVAKLSLTLAFEALESDSADTPLLPPDVAVTDFSFGRRRPRGVKLIRAATGYLLRATRRGEYTLEAQFVVRVEKRDKTRSLTLPLIPAARATTELTLPEPSVDLTLSPLVSYEIASSGGATVLTIFGAAEKQVTVTWKPKLEPKKIAPVVFADQNAQVTVGRGVLRVDTTLDYTILQGKVKELRISLPPDATLLSVKGANLRTWDVVAEGAARVLKVQLLDEVADRYSLQLQLEQAIGKAGLGQAASFPIPTIVAEDVERETGAVGILVWKGLKVEPVKTDGVTQVDIREMPATFQKLKDEVHLAYRYLQRPFTIEARVSEVEAKVSADVQTTVRVSPEALRFAARIHYVIKDAGIFRFRIKLGKDVKLVDLEGENINNWEREADTLVVDLRSKAEGPYTLTLETEQPVPQGQGEVDVAAIELLDVARERGHLALAAYPGIKIEPVTVENIMQVDVTDLPHFRSPPPSRQGKAASVKSSKRPSPQPPPEGRGRADLAFRYLKHPYKLRIAISKVQAEVAATIHTAIEVSEKHADVTVALQYDIRKAGIFQLQVALPKGFRLLGCDGKSIDDWKVTEGTLTVSLKQKTEGSYALRLTGKQDVADLAQVALPAFQAMGAEKETGFLAVRADESLRVKAGQTEGLAEIDVKELPTELQAGKVLLAFKYFAPGWSATLAAEPIEPHVTAETFTFLSLGEALLQASVTVRYTVLYAGVQTFRIQLPEDATNVDITAEDIKHREEDKANHIWTISLQAKKKDDYRLFVTFQQELGRESVDLQYAGLHVLDVKRETGYLAVAARADLELSAGEKLEGLTPIDPQEIPADYKVGITAPILLAFRYLKHPYTLHAAAVRHDPADVLVAIIEACLLSTTLTEDGNLITDMTCRLRNTREQNLAIALPQGAELWHVFVDGKRAIPVQAKEGDVLWTKVPIAGIGDGTRAFLVQLRYGRTVEELGGHGVLEFDFPRLAIPAMRLGWQIALPEKYRLVRHDGSLRYVDYLDRDLAALMRQIVPVERRRPAGEQARTKSNLSQFDANKSVMWNIEQVAGGIKGGRAGGQRSIYTGTKPQTANLYHFQSLIAMKTAGNIRSVYLRTSVDHVIQGALVVATAAAMLAFWALCRRRARAWRVAVLIALALIVLGARTLMEEAYRQHISDVLWTLALGALALLAWDGLKAIAAATSKRAAAEQAPGEEGVAVAPDA